MNSNDLKVKTVFALMTVLWLATMPAAADPQSVRFYEDARTRLLAGDAEGAMIQLKRTLQLDPGQLAAKILLGETYLALGEAKAAEEELIQARQLGADASLVALPLAKARNRLGKFDTNIKEIVPTLLPPLQQADIWVELGIARLNSKDDAGATQAFDEALRLDPGHGGALTGLARIPLMEGDFVRAQELARQAVTLSPDNEKAWFVLGAATQSLGQFEEAADAYARAYSIDPLYLQAATGEAAALLDGNRTREAATLLGSLHDRFPYSVLVPYLLHQALDRLGEKSAASKALDDAATIVGAFSPEEIENSPGDQLLFGTIMFEHGQLEQAYRFLNSYVNGGGSDLRGRKMLARTLISLDRPGDALRVLVRITANRKTDAETLELVGDANVGLGDFDAAQRAYMDALRNHRGGPSVVRRMALAQYASGERSEALQNMQRLIEILPEGSAPNTTLLLGLLLLSDNRLEEARQITLQLLQSEPRHETGRNLLATILVNQGEAQRGRQIYQELVAENPAFRPAVFNLIRLDLVEQRYDSAAIAIDRLLQANPTDAEALYESARLKTLLGNTRDAIPQLQQVRGQRPNWIKPADLLIDALISEARVAEAISQANAYVADNADDADALLLLARAYSGNRDARAARGALKRAAAAAARDPQKLFAIGQRQFALGAHEDVTRTLQQALAAASEAADASLMLAASFIHLGELAKAEATLDRLEEFQPGLVPARILRADIRRAQGRFTDAIPLYRAALAESGDETILQNLYLSLNRAGESISAVTLLNEWLQDHPDSMTARSLLAQHYLANGEMDRARAFYRELTTAQPQNAQAWNNLAVALEGIDAEQATKAARKAYALAPSNPFVLDTLGWSLVQIGELNEGLGYLREARARNSRSATVRYHLGVALQEYGKYQEALIELRTALSMGTDFSGRDDAQLRVGLLEALGR
jgi:putative PEP-CTERM system TPR-repeat lipoprotein